MAPTQSRESIPSNAANRGAEVSHALTAPELPRLAARRLRIHGAGCARQTMTATADHCAACLAISLAIDGRLLHVDAQHVNLHACTPG